MKTLDARVTGHKKLSEACRIITFEAARIAAAARPGQFVHLKVPNLPDATLRRPFSIFTAGNKTISVLYRVVGKGTRAMTALQRGAKVSIVGPLGNGYPMPRAGALPVLVAGGYGVAPLHFLARRIASKGICIIGGASRPDILCADRFKALGWKVAVTTEDGTMGRRGLVTHALDALLVSRRGRAGTRAPARASDLEFYACGPTGMLREVAKRAISLGYPAWLSMETHMGCGMGACLACVVRTRRTDGKTEWTRVCRDGPVFECRRIVW